MTIRQHASPRADDAPKGLPSVAAFVPADLYAFQRAVLASDLAPVVKCLAVAISLTSAGRSGERATIDEAALMAVAGCSRPTLYRHLTHLRGTWLEQTSAPTYGGKGMPSRRARYGLRVPESCLTPTQDGETGLMEESCLTATHEPETRVESRVSSEPKSCLVAPHETERVRRVLVRREPTPLPPAVGSGVDEGQPKTGGRDLSEINPKSDPVPEVVALLNSECAADARECRSFPGLVATLTQKGWTARGIADALNARGVRGFDRPGAGTAVAAKELLAAPVPPPPLQAKPWCGRCDSPTYRFHLDDDGRNPEKCECHPGWRSQGRQLPLMASVPTGSGVSEDRVDVDDRAPAAVTA